VTFAGDVYDGDSIEIEGQPARLYGIDAFELSQTCLDERGTPWRCGIAAKAALAERIEGQALQCVVLDEDQDGWYVARCVGEDGADLGAYMVRSGLALADTKELPGRRGRGAPAARWRLGRRIHAAVAMARGRALTGAPRPGRSARLSSIGRACLPQGCFFLIRRASGLVRKRSCPAAARNKPWWRFAPVAITSTSTDQMRRVWQ
jgi:hypothetical protein